MELGKKEIEHIAKLARLGLNEKEKEKYSKELSGILDYMNKLNEIKVENVETTAQVTGLLNVFRNDGNPHDVDADKIKKMIGQSPEREDNFVKTKSILEK